MRLCSQRPFSDAFWPRRKNLHSNYFELKIIVLEKFVSNENSISWTNFGSTNCNYLNFPHNMPQYRFQTRKVFSTFVSKFSNFNCYHGTNLPFLQKELENTKSPSPEPHLVEEHRAIFSTNIWWTLFFLVLNCLALHRLLHFVRWVSIILVVPSHFPVQWLCSELKIYCLATPVY